MRDGCVANHFCFSAQMIKIKMLAVSTLENEESAQGLSKSLVYTHQACHRLSNTWHNCRT